MALKRRLTDQDSPFLRVIRRRTSVKSVCVPDEEDSDHDQSQTGSNDPVYDMILIDYDVEDEVESPISQEDELKAIIPQLPAIIETQKLQARRQQQQKQEKKRKQKQQEENAVWDAVWDYYQKQSEKHQKNERRKQEEEEEKQQNMTVIDYDEIESPVSEEDDMIELEAEEIILEKERLLARKRRHKQEPQQQMNDNLDEAWSIE